MGSPENHDKGPTHGHSAKGYSAAYEADRPRAEQSLKESMTAAPSPIGRDDTSLKNPDGEFANPAPMSKPASGTARPGPNGVGNSKGDGSIDPQGQQGGTHGGQPASPSLSKHEPLANAEERIEQSTQRSAGGHAKGPA